MFALLFGDAVVLLADLLRPTSSSPGPVLLGVARLVLFLVGLLLVVNEDSARRRALIVAVAVVANAMFAVPIGAYRGQPDTMLVTVVATTVGAAVLMPWSPRFQSSVIVAVSMVLLVGHAAGVAPSPVLLAVGLAGMSASALLARDMEHSRIELWTAEAESRAAEERAATLQSSLHESIVAQTAELSDALSEIEQLCRSASHDLRPPLRTMAGYAEIAREQRAAHGTGEEAPVAITLLAQQMADRIDGLLREVRETHRSVSKGLLSLSEAVENIRAELLEPRCGAWSIAQGIGTETLGESSVDVLEQLVRFAVRCAAPDGVREICFDSSSLGTGASCALTVTGHRLDEGRKRELVDCLDGTVGFSAVPADLHGIVIAARRFSMHQGGKVSVRFPADGVLEFVLHRAAPSGLREVARA